VNKDVYIKGTSFVQAVRSIIHCGV